MDVFITIREQIIDYVATSHPTGDYHIHLLVDRYLQTFGMVDIDRVPVDEFAALVRECEIADDGLFRVLTTAREVIAERGKDYVYPADKRIRREETMDGQGMCRYWHEEDNTAGCIVGTILHRLGVGAQTLSTYEGSSSNAIVDRVMPSLSVAARRFLSNAQMTQDRGATWQQAIEGAAECLLREERFKHLQPLITRALGPDLTPETP